MSLTESRSKILMDAEPNSWIALSGDESELVGKGSTYAEAVAEAENAGVSDPVLIKTPQEWVPFVL